MQENLENHGPYHSNPSGKHGDTDRLCPYCGKKERLINVTQKASHCVCRLEYYGHFWLKFFDLKYALACKAENLAWEYFSKDAVHGRGQGLEGFLYRVYCILSFWIFYPWRNLRRLMGDDIYPIVWCLIFHPVKLLKAMWANNCWKLFPIYKPWPLPRHYYQGKYLQEIGHELYYRFDDLLLKDTQYQKKKKQKT